MISTNVLTLRSKLFYGCYTEQRFMEHFHWLVPQTMATQVGRQILHCAMLKKFVATVAESRTQFYVPQRFLQLVSATDLCNWSLQRFWPLQGTLHASGNDSCNLFRNGVARQVARRIAQCNSALIKTPHLLWCAFVFNIWRSKYEIGILLRLQVLPLFT